MDSTSCLEFSVYFETNLSKISSVVCFFKLVQTLQVALFLLLILLAIAVDIYRKGLLRGGSGCWVPMVPH